MSAKRKIMIGISALIILAALIVAIVFYATGSMVTPINRQLAALKAGDTVKAYSYTSKDFQNVTSLSDFQNFVDNYPALRDNKGISFTEKEANEDNTGKVKAVIHLADGSSLPIQYLVIKENGKWMILGITVNSANASSAENANALENPITENLPPTKLYDNPDSKYTIKYPANWEVDNSTKGTVIFSGKHGTPSYYSTVNIQTVLTKKTGGSYATIKDFMTDLKNQAKSQSSNAKFLKQSVFNIPGPEGVTLQGEFIIFTYTYQGQLFKQWQIVVMRNDQQVFYAWAYTSPVEQYDHDLSTAEAMLKTWTIY